MAPNPFARMFAAPARTNPAAPRRRRRRAQETVYGDAYALQAAAAGRTRDRHHVPAPPGLEFPHRKGSTRCDPDHPAWNGYVEALEDARERGAIECADAPAPAACAPRVVRAALGRDPRFAAWDATEGNCVAAYAARRARRRAAGDSSTRQAARARAAFVRAGGDVTSAEYLDTLAPASRAKALRRAGRTAEARAVESHLRARRRKGAGVPSARRNPSPPYVPEGRFQAHRVSTLAPTDRVGLHTHDWVVWDQRGWRLATLPDGSRAEFTGPRARSAAVRWALEMNDAAARSTARNPARRAAGR
jgi:hypothetical protein